MSDSKRVRISKREGALVRMLMHVTLSYPPQLANSVWFPSLLNLASINASKGSSTAKVCIVQEPCRRVQHNNIQVDCHGGNSFAGKAPPAYVIA